jgi:hypothetical protein
MDFHTVPLTPASQIANSPSTPDLNDSALHEVIGTVLASWCPSFSQASRKQLAEVQKFRSPISLALLVLKAQFLALKRRTYLLEDENGTLKIVNATLLSKISSVSGDLARLRADYNALLCDRKKLTLAAERDQRKIRALTSDIDNAQQFIMAMVDIKLHENFLHVAANETVGSGKDAEKSLAKAIAQEADREGSLWARILSLVVDVHSTKSYGVAVDLALHDSRSRSASLPGARPRPPTPFSVSQQSPTPRSSSVYNPNSKSETMVGLGIHSNHGSPPVQFATIQAVEMSRPRPHLSSKSENVKQKPAREKSVQCLETHNQSHTKKPEKRKGIVVIDKKAMASVSVRIFVSCAERLRLNRSLCPEAEQG